MHPEIEKMINHSFEYAQELLIDTKEFYPFASFIDTIGNVHPMEFDFDKKNMPTVGKVIDTLKTYCQKEMSDQKIKGFSLTFEAELKLTDEGALETCIATEVFHSEETDIPDFYMTYQINAENDIDFGELFGVKK